MPDRRYNDKGIAAIFRAATELPSIAERAEVPRDEGLTLADLQAIGREVGIPADAVAQAAQALDVRPGAASRRFLGLPIGVSRTVNLNRRLTDEEWERLVVQLREVFNARGRTRFDRRRVFRARRDGHRRHHERAWGLLRRSPAGHGAPVLRGCRHDYQRRRAAAALGAPARAADGGARGQGRAAPGFQHTAGGAAARIA